MKRLSRIPLAGVTLDQLIEEFRTVGEPELRQVEEGAGRARGDDVEPGWIHGLRNYWPVTPERWELERFPMLSVAIMNLSIERAGRLGGSARRVEGVILNELAPGSELDPHRDGPPHHERWHLPLITNPAVEYWEEKLDAPVHMDLGFWHGPIDHSSRHWMRNKGNEHRVHVIVDLERTDSDRSD